MPHSNKAIHACACVPGNKTLFASMNFQNLNINLFSIDINHI